MSVNRAFVKQPKPTSTFRVFQAPGYEMRLLASDWSDLVDLRSWLKGADCTGAYVLSGMEGTRPVAYVGEGSRLWDRLPKHCSDAPFERVQTIHVLCSPEDYDKAAALFFQEQLSDRLKLCGRLERVGGDPARLGIPPDRLEELQRQLEPAIALFGFAGCAAFVPARTTNGTAVGEFA